jgi:CPA2 family monovalent cation:H+ antiporter-2
VVSPLFWDNNLKTVQLMCAFGFSAGESGPAPTSHTQVSMMRLCWSALDDKDAAVNLVKYARSHRP